jgi:hypothetical protein
VVGEQFGKELPPPSSPIYRTNGGGGMREGQHSGRINMNISKRDNNDEKIIEQMF